MSDPRRGFGRRAEGHAGSRTAVQPDGSFAADTIGVLPYAGPLGVSRRNFAAAFGRRWALQARIKEANVAYLVIDPRPGLHIVDVNQHYADMLEVRRCDLRGKKLFEAFPDNPDAPGTNGVDELYTSLCQAAETRLTHCMETLRYDVADASGAFIEHYWRPANTPVYDDEDRLLFLLNHARDVTADVLKARANRQ